MSKVKCPAYSNCSANITVLLRYTCKKKKKIDGENEEIGGREMTSKKDTYMGIKESVVEFVERQISVPTVSSWAGLLSTQKWATSI